MEALLIYIIQVNILLAISYLGYRFLLRKLTFYQSNRNYFLLSVVFAFTYPFLDLKALFQKHIEPISEYVSFIPEGFFNAEARSMFTLDNILLSLLLFGILVFTLKFLMQMVSLLRIHLNSKPAKWQEYLYRNVFIPIVPFSFLKKIYVNKQQHEELELQDIFKHEDIHVKGLHTIDILLFEMVLICCWYNPFVWLMRKAVRENLEFLTDQHVLNKGFDKQTYQYSLLNVTKQGIAIGISNQFNFKSLKKRITMMNKKRSSKLELSKYAFLFPLFIFTAGAFTIDTADAKIAEVVQVAQETDFKAISKDLSQTVQTTFEAVPDTVVKENVKEVKDTVVKSTFNYTYTSNNNEGLDTVIFESSTDMGAQILFRGTKKTVQPLLIVDGVEQISSDLGHVDPNAISHIEVLKDASAETLYGSKGANGVVKITTKGNTDAPQVRGKVTGIRISTKSDTSKISKSPLYIIDGKETSSDYFKTIDPNNIESVSILKDASATAIYGEKAKEGVILVATKVNGVVVQGKPTGTSNNSVVVTGYGSRNASANFNSNDVNEGYVVSKTKPLAFKKASNEKLKITLTEPSGSAVYTNTDYKNNWKGGDLKDGRYYYVLEKSKGTETEILKGYFLIKNQ
ncbi:TonB-dependent receptor plug domain-containing protein [Sphingobacterium hungaricum]